MAKKMNAEAKLAALTALIAPLAAVSDLLRDLAAEAGDVPRWNKGGTGHAAVETVAKLHAALAAPEPKPKKQTREEQWTEAAGDAQDAAARLVSLQDEFNEWRESLPENLEGSATAEKLDAICDLDLVPLSDTADEASDLEVPKGFGRD